MAFEDGEGFLDWIEVGRISWQWQQLMPVLGEDFGDFCLVVEWRVIHDDKTLWPECGHQHLGHPCRQRQVSATCLEQHGGDPICPPLCHDEIGSLVRVARNFTKHFTAPGRPAMRPVRIGLKPALVKINDVLPAMLGNKSAQAAQEYNSFFVTRLTIPGRFFW